MNNGVLYMAAGDEYIAEAIESIDSLRSQMPDLPITLLANKRVAHSGADDVRLLDDPEYSYADSIISFDNLPYDRTLFFDTDIHIADDVSELFDALDRFDLGAAMNPDPRYYDGEVPTYAPDNVPDCFPLVNSGVLAFKKNQRVKKLLDLWNDRYYSTLEANSRGYNQPALREALYKSDVRMFTIPPEYNCYIDRPGSLSGDVKVVHGRCPDMEQVVAKLNKTTAARVHTRNGWPISVESDGRQIRFQVREAMNRHGTLGMFKRGLSLVLG